MAGGWCLPARRSAVEPPARGAVRLLAGNAKDGAVGEAVQVPGRRSGARGAVRCRERVPLRLRRPSVVAIVRGQSFHGRPIRHPRHLALEHQVKADDVYGSYLAVREKALQHERKTPRKELAKKK